jgi:hypothetical protein
MTAVAITQALDSLDPKAMFDHAQKFQLTQEYLRSNDRVTTPEHLNEHIRMCADPCFVLSALASELFLKCLLVIGGKEKDEFGHLHNLDQLFSKLTPNIQNRIRELWDQQVWSLGSREAIDYAQDTIANGSAIPRDFAAALRLGAKTFVELRYVYEKKRNINNLIIDLPLILRRVIVEIQPGWRT